MTGKRGRPLSGVKAQAYAREYDYQSRSYINKTIDSYLSDENGYFTIPAQTGNLPNRFTSNSAWMTISIYTENYFYLYPPQPEEKSRITTHFFTDRSIYRPGQTIYFKGIVLEIKGCKK